MRKEEAVAEMRALGYDAELVNGVVRIHVAQQDYPGFKEIENALKQVGYKSSWGIDIVNHATGRYPQ